MSQQTLSMLFPYYWLEYPFFSAVSTKPQGLLKTLCFSFLSHSVGQGFLTATPVVFVILSRFIFILDSKAVFVLRSYRIPSARNYFHYSIDKPASTVISWLVLHFFTYLNLFGPVQIVIKRYYNLVMTTHAGPESRRQFYYQRGFFVTAFL